MQYFCVEHEQCGFHDHSYDIEEYKDLICPNCYSPLLKYPDGSRPLWAEERTKHPVARSDER